MKYWLAIFVCSVLICLPLAASEAESSVAIVRLLNSRSSGDACAFDQAAQRIAHEAKQGQPLQQYVMAVLAEDHHASDALQLNEETRQKYLKASRPRILSLAHRTNNGLAWYLLSLETNDVKLLKKAADCGNVQALNALGTLVMSNPRASEELRRRAVSFFQQAAEQNDANGLYNLGNCYLQGFGGEKNPQKAFASLLKAAERGHPIAMDEVAAVYDRGLWGIPMNVQKALMWQMRSRAAQGHQAAREWLEENKCQ